MSLVVDDSNRQASERFFAAVDQATAVGTRSLTISSKHDSTVRVAFDCEGVNLCRVGTVELVSIRFENSIREDGEVFLVDLKGEPSKVSERVQALKKLFGCKDVQKVIHDSRMDCDALYHLHGIIVVNVHDTSCCHSIITGREDASLNDLLIHNRISENEIRDKSVYKSNPSFWATRPLTTRMISWAASDVDKLLLLARMQKDKLESSGNYSNAMEKSSEFTVIVRDMKLARGLECRVNVGRFIGHRGSNLRSLQKHTKTMIHREHESSGEKWMVFYHDPNSLELVKSAMGY